MATLLENIGLITLIVVSLIVLYLYIKCLVTGEILDPREQGWVEILKFLMLLAICLFLLATLVPYLPKPGF